MNTIEVSFTTPGATFLLDLLKREVDQLPAQQKKMVNEMTKQIHAQINKSQEHDRIFKDQFARRADVKLLANIIQKALPEIKRRGCSREVVAYARKLDEIFTRNDGVLDEALAEHNNYRTNVKKVPGLNMPGLPQDVFSSHLSNIRPDLLRATTQFIASPHTPLSPSASFTMFRARQQAAKACATAGYLAAKRAARVEDINLTSIAVYEFTLHMRLAVAILSGNKQRIFTDYEVASGCADRPAAVGKFFDTIDYIARVKK